MYFKKIAILILLFVPLYGGDYNDFIILKINGHEHYLPDAIEKTVRDIFLSNKQEIENKILDFKVPDFLVVEAKLGSKIGNIKIFHDNTNGSVSDIKFFVWLIWKEPMLII